MHFRCGDVPFDKHRVYRMPSVPYLNFVAGYMSDHNISQANIYWAPAHTKNQNHIKGCLAMLTDLKGFFATKDIRVTFVNELDPWKTLNAFSQAKLLVGLVPSSFVFSVGVARDMSFITPFLGLSRVKGKNTLDVVDAKRAWNMAQNGPLDYVDAPGASGGRALTYLQQ